jgi:hypothetical protein
MKVCDLARPYGTQRMRQWQGPSRCDDPTRQQIEGGMNDFIV